MSGGRTLTRFGTSTMPSRVISGRLDFFAVDAGRSVLLVVDLAPAGLPARREIRYPSCTTRGKKKRKAPACCYNAKPNATRVLGVHAKWPARYVRASSAVDHFFFFHPRHLSAMTPTSKNARTLVSSFLLFFFFVFRVCEHPSRLV